MFDLIIKNGTICDGTGKPSFRGDIAIKGDKIAAVGDFHAGLGEKIIDASGKTVTPGFIDPHTHVDMTVYPAPHMEPYLKQGVTTVVTGNCGHGSAPLGDEIFYSMIYDTDYMADIDADEFQQLALFPTEKKATAALKKHYGVDLDWHSFGEFLEKCDELPLGCNVAQLAAYNPIKSAVMGEDSLREATATELDRLEALIRACMEEGAFGFSTGRDPFYIPGPYATDAETIRMLKTVKAYDGIFASHTYNYNKDGRADRMGGYMEMLNQAKAADIRANVSHVHVIGMAETPEAAADAAVKTLDYFDRERQAGLDLTYDVIPTPAVSDYTLPSIAFHIKPLIMMTGSTHQLAKNLEIPEFRKMVNDMAEDGPLSFMDENWFADMCVLKHKNPAYIGKSLLKCAMEMNRELIPAFMDIFRQDPAMIADMTAPSFGKSVEILMNQSIAMPCSDGTSFAKEFNLTGHPELPVYTNSTNISYIPRYLTHYADEAAGGFEEAVRRASSLPAECFDIKNRGVIKEGNFADIVILDRSALHSFDEDPNPLQDPLGIELVLVNGQIAAEKGCLTGQFTGRMLRKR